MIDLWKKEEEIAHIHGWDFSHIDGRCVEEPLPWDYRQVVRQYLRLDMKLLEEQGCIEGNAHRFLLVVQK